jgi:hypothetical protein
MVSSGNTKVPDSKILPSLMAARSAITVSTISQLLPICAAVLTIEFVT